MRAKFFFRWLMPWGKEKWRNIYTSVARASVPCGGALRCLRLRTIRVSKAYSFLDTIAGPHVSVKINQDDPFHPLPFLSLHALALSRRAIWISRLDDASRISPRSSPVTLLPAASLHAGLEHRDPVGDLGRLQTPLSVRLQPEGRERLHTLGSRATRRRLRGRHSLGAEQRHEGRWPRRRGGSSRTHLCAFVACTWL